MGSLFKKIFYRIIKKQNNLVGLSILRVTIGLHLLWQLILSYPIKEELWTTPYLNPYVDFLHNNSMFLIFYYLGILIMILYTVGLGSIIFNLVVYIYVLILYFASPFLGDGGSNILMIILAYMIFTNNSRYISLFPRKPSHSYYAKIAHNSFLILVLIQTCILYFFAGFFKAQGEMWIHGTALYYVLNVDAFSMNLTGFVGDIISNSPFLLTIGAYTAILIQLFFPILVLNKYTRYLVLIGSIGFHLMIVFVMGLVQFGFIMIALDMAFINDKEYKVIIKFLKNIFLRIRNTFNFSKQSELLNNKKYS
ncbi:HTTM domain-containing protein [Cytobacillus kochii]|uniref:HTTM-like domain-containing protein n=1 Tax=Cytobacillus kochii TaxID=859143 RepID=A0A248TH68_9BACI|nr:HTTM domain-containing protein [Cytobacillus kochii]ASV67469.1 hypothetical protein CKF48_09085 [Cytobacillus kochii]